MSGGVVCIIKQEKFLQYGKISTDSKNVLKYVQALLKRGTSVVCS